MSGLPDPDRPQRQASAGGVFVAIGAVVGATVGVFLRQPSAGLVIGIGLGTAVALALWWRDRQRS